MKIMLLVLLLFPISIYSQRNYAIGQKVYCWAVNGLNLREAPSKNSTKILKVPYLSYVSVIDTIKGDVFVDTLNKDQNYPLIIHGNWLKVSFEDKVGFVFDGYLSRLKPQMCNEYFSNILFKSVDTILYFDTVVYKSCYELYKSKNGSFYKHIYEDGCWSHHYFFSKFSFEEGVMLMAETFKPDDYECPLKIESSDGVNFYFVDCTLTTLRQIRIAPEGIYIFTYDCT